MSPDRESELSYAGVLPSVNVSLLAETLLLRNNVSIVFDLHFGKFYARVNNAVFDNFKVELAQTSPGPRVQPNTTFTPVPGRAAPRGTTILCDFRFRKCTRRRISG